MDRDCDQVAKETLVLTDSGARLGLWAPEPMPLAPSSPSHFLPSSGPTAQSPRAECSPVTSGPHTPPQQRLPEAECGCSTLTLQPSLSACSSLNSIFSGRAWRMVFSSPFYTNAVCLFTQRRMLLRFMKCTYREVFVSFPLWGRVKRFW